MKLAIVLSLLSLFIYAEKIKVWKEKAGVVIAEAEHVQNRNSLPPYWEIVRFLKGFEDDGFVQWKGTSYLKESYEDITEGRILTYHISVQKEGDYYLKIKGICFDETQANVLVRINSGDWKNFVIENDGNVNWDSNQASDSYPVFFPMGYHKVEIAGVNSGFLFDKFMLVNGSLFDLQGKENFAIPYEEKRESKNEYISDETFPVR